MIRFSDKQWDQVIENHRKWWKGELGRPILPVILYGADPGRAMPRTPVLSFSNCSDFSISPDAIIDRMDYELSSCEYYGDSFPLRDWSDVYRKISASGKKIMAEYGMDSYLDEILAVIKKPDDLIKMPMTYPINEKEEVFKNLARYGV